MCFNRTGYIIIKPRFINLGAPTSPCFAEIYIQRVEENHIYTMLNAPRLWYRKVDNTFAITSHDLGETLQKLNDTDENIIIYYGKGIWRKFTISGLDHKFKWKERNKNKSI